MDSTDMRPGRKRGWKVILVICLALLAAIAAVYWPLAHSQFIQCDDPEYVFQNPHIQAGVHWAGIKWALTTGYANNWHPLTWLSHMLDWQLYGSEAGGHHVTNVIFHAANTILLFFFLRCATKALWSPALVAALFALHPVHVESVAWVSERKDVLSTFFLMLALIAYERHARTSATGYRAGIFRSRFYWLCLLAFALGLMSKPMLVTLPLLLLLLDVWPLARLRLSGGKQDASDLQRFIPPRRLLWEKAPFLVLSIACSIVTVLVQRQRGNMSSLEGLPLTLRFSNAFVSCAKYLGKTFWPVDLASFYPYTKSLPLESVLLCAILLGATTVFACVQLKRRPWLTVGWFWFCIALVPVIGVIQVGSQSMADRYTYIPLIGIFIAVAWALGELTRTAFVFRSFAGVAAALTLSALAVTARKQVLYWHDGETLFRHTLAVTGKNAHAQLNLGAALMTEGKISEAEDHFKEALRIRPGYPEAESDLGLTLAAQGRLDEAIALYRSAIARYPNRPKLHYLLGNALMAQGKRTEAVAEYESELRINPAHPLALNDLAWILATDPNPALRNGPRAVRLSERACQASGFQLPQLIGTLAAAYAEDGRFNEAVAMTEKARSLAIRSGQTNLARRNETLETLYKKHLPFHEERQSGIRP